MTRSRRVVFDKGKAIGELDTIFCIYPITGTYEVVMMLVDRENNPSCYLALPIVDNWEDVQIFNLKVKA